MQPVFLLFRDLRRFRCTARAKADIKTSPAQPLHKSRTLVLTLATLFSLDAFAGDLIVQSLLALWLYHGFGSCLAATGAIFFWSGVFSAASHLNARTAPNDGRWRLQPSTRHGTRSALSL
ncbi:hypothetical protein IE4872_CH03341 [Rhizobium gallicum]|uniref:Uncharacterized protein n=1 Tax=Rhizobium gallicum TaxID=56730 RepID=A0A1L5NM05_9HYPH|nr:hypothetical protein IE4872_CH03341 [Rhizobium gallicum]